MKLLNNGAIDTGRACLVYRIESIESIAARNNPLMLSEGEPFPNYWKPEDRSYFTGFYAIKRLEGDRPDFLKVWKPKAQDTMQAIAAIRRELP